MITAAQIFAYVPLTGDVGFALPLLHVEGAEGFFVQEVDEWEGVVVQFRKFSDDGEPICLTQPGTVCVRAAPAFVFVSPNGEAHCGTLDELEPTLRDCAQHLPNRADLKLQIFELVGSPEEKQLARFALRRQLERDLGNEAALSYQKSALLDQLWSLLLSKAPDRVSAERVLDLRPRLEVNLDDNGTISLNLLGLDTEFAWVDAEGLCQELAIAFPDTISTDEDAGPVDAQDQDLLFHGALAARQEERMVLLLHAMLTEPGNAWELAKTYKPRTLFEERTMDVLRRHLHPDFRPTQFSLSTMIQFCAYKIFQEVYPRNRGRYLLFLARHLGDQKDIASFVSEKVSASNAIDIVPYREEIAEALNRRF